MNADSFKYKEKSISDDQRKSAAEELPKLLLNSGDNRQ